MWSWCVFSFLFSSMENKNLTSRCSGFLVQWIIERMFLTFVLVIEVTEVSGAGYGNHLSNSGWRPTGDDIPCSLATCPGMTTLLRSHQPFCPNYTHTHTQVLTHTHWITKLSHHLKITATTQSTEWHTGGRSISEFPFFFLSSALIRIFLRPTAANIWAIRLKWANFLLKCKHIRKININVPKMWTLTPGCKDMELPINK